VPENTEDNLRSDPAEAALLGALGFHAESMTHVLAFVAPDDFYKPAREAVWSIARKLHANRQPIDPVAICRQLHADGRLTAAVEQLISAEMTRSRPVHVAEAYAETVVDYSRRRAALRACQRATDLVVTHPGDLSEALALARAELDKLTVNDEQPNTLTWSQLVDEFDVSHAPGGAPPGIPSPWWKLDTYTHGLFPGRMYVFGGRPGIGKSTAALNVAIHAAVGSNKQVLIFSAEMPSVDVTGRILASRAEVDLGEIAAYNLSPESKQRIADWRRKVGNLPLRINARPTSLAQIKNQARAQHTRVGLDILVVDYLQLIRADAGRNREQEVAQVSRELKGLAMELGCVVILPAQLNRGSVTRADPRPTMADLRDSGQIEQDADAVILLYKPVDEYGAETRGIQFLVDKNRHGSTGVVDLDWHGAYGLIR
jgi:replicative DNA helicase